MKKNISIFLLILVIISIITAFYFYKLSQTQKTYLQIKDSIEDSLYLCSTKYVYEEIITRTQKIKMGKEARLCVKVNGEIKAGSGILNIKQADNTYIIYLTEPNIISHDIKVVEDITINRHFNKISPVEFVNILGEQKSMIEKKLQEVIIKKAKDDYQLIISGYQNAYRNLKFEIQYDN